MKHLINKFLKDYSGIENARISLLVHVSTSCMKLRDLNPGHVFSWSLYRIPTGDECVANNESDISLPFEVIPVAT